MQLWEQFCRYYNNIYNSTFYNNSTIDDEFIIINGVSSEKMFTKKETKYKVISIGNFSTRYKYVENGNYIDSNNKLFNKNFIPIKNDLVMILNNKTQSLDILGKVILIDENDKYYINQRTMILRSKNNNGLKWYYIFKNIIFRRQIKKIANSGNQSYINISDVKLLFLPNINDINNKYFWLMEFIDKNQTYILKKINLLKKQKKYYLKEMFV